MDPTYRLGFISGYAGHWFLSKITRIVDQLAFFYICIKMAFRYHSSGRRLMYRILVQQIYFTGVQSLELIAGLAFVFGTILVVRGFPQLEKVGSLDELSVVIILVLIRELGPVLTAIIVILRSGSAIAMEIGYMNVLGEIEGLEMQGIPTIHFLCIPRIIGVAVSVICLMILFDLIAILGGFLAFSTVEGITVWSFVYNLAATMKFSDFLVVAVKGLGFGLTIPVVCLYNGFMATEAITTVPPRVSRALVDCLIYTVGLSIMISAAFPI